MFNFSKEELENLGAEITTREIRQQPELWEETLQIYKDNKERIDDFLSMIREKHDHIRVTFSGAGTSAFVGQTIAPYLSRVNDKNKITFEALETTNIVTHPESYFQEDVPTILVSYARSGNSPESVATVQLAESIVKDLYQITITCAKDGKLAKFAEGDKNNLLLLQPDRSNDKGFAMTGSYTCMVLTSLLVFDPAEEEVKENYVKSIIEMANTVIEREEEIQKVVDKDFDRVVYLGADTFFGLSREAQLKILELTAGKVTTLYDSPVGFRHGPKSYVDEKTLVNVFVSTEEYPRRYDRDLINEVFYDEIALDVNSIMVGDDEEIKGNKFVFDNKYENIPNGYLALPYVLYAQRLALGTAVKLGNKPDTPSPTGTVNRVVKGVVIYPYGRE